MLPLLWAGDVDGVGSAELGITAGGGIERGLSPIKSLLFSLESETSSASLISFGKMRATRGLRLGTHAHITETLTSTTDHINESDANPSRSCS